MGVRVRLSRNASCYIPFWVAIPFYFFWLMAVAMFWIIVVELWIAWAIVVLPIFGIAALFRNDDLSRQVLDSLNWRNRRRGSASGSSSRFQGKTKLPNGATWTCGHQHRTQSGADSCAQEAAREVMAGQPVSPAPVMPRNHCWYCGARKKDHDQAGNHPAPVVMPY